MNRRIMVKLVPRFKGHHQAYQGVVKEPEMDLFLQKPQTSASLMLPEALSDRLRNKLLSPREASVFLD